MVDSSSINMIQVYAVEAGAGGAQQAAGHTEARAAGGDQYSVQCTVQYSTVQYTVQVRTSLCYNLRTRSLGLAVLQLEGLQASAVEAG